MIGYKLTLDECAGWMFLGCTPKDVADSMRNEIESHEGLSLQEISGMSITPFEITQEEIDNMPEFEGW